MIPGSAGSIVHDDRLPRVLFGVGSVVELPEELDRLGAERIVVVCTPRRGESVERVLALLEGRVVGVHEGARPHVPVEVVAEAAEVLTRFRADFCLAVGGGTAVGLAKALRREGGPPYAAVPTTYSGSEMTPVWGITTAGRKATGRDPRVRASLVVYDPSLTASLPRNVAAASGMNALAHAAEALYAADATPATALLAEEAARALASALPALVASPLDISPRTLALYGAWLAGSALALTSMGLHHRMCHVLGGDFGLPHAETHAVVLPHVLAFNEPVARDAVQRLALAIGAQHAPSALFDLGAALDSPRSLRHLGMREADLDAAAVRTTESPYPNPRPYDARDVRAILQRAWLGRRPDPSQRPST